MKILSLFICFSLLISSLSAEQLSPRTANYVIDVHLDTVTKKLTAQSELEWTNPSDDIITELHFHIYARCFDG